MFRTQSLTFRLRAFDLIHCTSSAKRGSDRGLEARSGTPRTCRTVHHQEVRRATDAKMLEGKRQTAACYFTQTVMVYIYIYML